MLSLSSLIKPCLRFSRTRISDVLHASVVSLQMFIHLNSGLRLHHSVTGTLNFP